MFFQFWISFVITFLMWCHWDKQSFPRRWWSSEWPLVIVVLYNFYGKVFQTRWTRCIRFSSRTMPAAHELSHRFKNCRCTDYHYFIIVDLIRCKQNLPMLMQLISFAEFGASEMQRNSIKRMASLSHRTAHVYNQIEANETTPSRSQKFLLMFFFRLSISTYQHIYIWCSQCVTNVSATFSASILGILFYSCLLVGVSVFVCSWIIHLLKIPWKQFAGCRYFWYAIIVPPLPLLRTMHSTVGVNYYIIGFGFTAQDWRERLESSLCARLCAAKRSSLRSLPTTVWVNIIFYAHTSSKRNEFINLQSNINRNSSTKHLVRFGSSVESHQQSSSSTFQFATV